MKRLLPTLVVLSIACGRDSTGPSFATVTDLAGRWNLTGLELVGVPNSAVKLDAKAQFGISATLSIAADGRAVITATAQGNQSSDTATIALRGDTLIYTIVNGLPAEYLLHGSGRTMTWTAAQTSDFFDLNGDGTPDESREIDTWQRF